MGRPLTGNVRAKMTERGQVFSLRFTVNGERQHETLPLGTTREQADEQLGYRLGDVARGIWQPPKPPPVIELPTDPTFHVFATELFDALSPEWQPSTRAAYRSELVNHLLPFFAQMRLSQLDGNIDAVDRYRQSKLVEAQRIEAAAAAGKPLTYKCATKNGHEYTRRYVALKPSTINKTITRLGQILEVALERKLIGHNPALGKKRKVKAPKPERTYLDRAEQIVSLLDAATRLDEAAKLGGRTSRKAMMATLVFGGMR
ncbi:MAG TPA: hypothetical protein VK538_12445, partial [Solirubrobacteraceae bacterium]|nr:hypothetical protein [Solirubrobacteraceae bacterium]